MCIVSGCGTHPNFNAPGSKQRTHCARHKVDGMVDVRHNRCVQCGTRPSFNLPGLKRATHCDVHKLDGMIDVINNSCIECGSQPSFNLPGSKTAIYCGVHKLDGMVNVRMKTCLYDWCDTQVHNSKYEGYCLRCFMYTFPDKPVSRQYKTKEQAVTRFLLDVFASVTWVCDKPVTGGCSRRRPDLCCDLGDQVVMVEIDENQHDTYDCSCENKRLMELSRDVGHRPIVFIRFNPDGYVDRDGKNHSSCFGPTKQGIMQVRKCKGAEWQHRLSVLRDVVHYWMQQRTAKTIEVVSLFFNDNNV